MSMTNRRIFVDSFVLFIYRLIAIINSTLC